MKFIRIIIPIVLIITSNFTYGLSINDWIQISNDNTQLLIDVLKEFSPESAARVGVEGQRMHVDDRMGCQIPDHGCRRRRPLHLLSRH